MTNQELRIRMKKGIITLAELRKEAEKIEERLRELEEEIMIDPSKSDNNNKKRGTK